MSAARVGRLLYRQLLKQARRLEREGALPLEIRPPLDTQAWLGRGGHHGWATPPPAAAAEALRTLLPWLGEATGLGDADLSGVFTAASLRGAVRAGFRRAAERGGDADRAVEALRVLLAQAHLARCSSSAITQPQGVRVDVSSAYVGSQAELDPDDDEGDGDEQRKLYFTYRVTVSNLGTEPVQIRARHWIIKDADGRVVGEVKRGSRGVVGLTPVLKPQSSFFYYSGTDARGGGASMEGSLQMRAAGGGGGAPDGAEFDAAIARFSFIAPPGK